jgi:transcription elongation factor Elf1
MASYRTTTSEAPTFDCPVCLEEWDDHNIDPNRDGKVECPNCGTSLEILSVETILSVTLGSAVSEPESEDATCA